MRCLRMSDVMSVGRLVLRRLVTRHLTQVVPELGDLVVARLFDLSARELVQPVVLESGCVTDRGPITLAGLKFFSNVVECVHVRIVW